MRLAFIWAPKTTCESRRSSSDWAGLAENHPVVSTIQQVPVDQLVHGRLPELYSTGPIAFPS